jgi:retinol-binding protein 3
VGETTGGGAHPGEVRRLAEHFRMVVPTGRAIDPRTHTNWEGTGVKPDVEAPANQALLTAELMALKDRSAKTTDPEQAEALRGFIREAQAQLDAMKGGHHAMGTRSTRSP